MMPYPPFRAAPDHATRDVCTKGGAMLLAAEIKQRWAECGVTVTTEIYEAVPLAHDSIWGVRVHGLNGNLSGGA